MDKAIREFLLNQFALRCFRDVADEDYIAARMAYRTGLLPQAFWSSQQALEKYLKGILLFRRVPRPRKTHSLKALLRDLEPRFPLNVSEDTRKFIEFIEHWNVDRYFIFPYHGEGLELMQLDMSVWDVRRYCIPVNPRLSPKGTPVAQLDLERIERATDRPPQKFRSRSTGVLERVLDDRKNAARSALIWKNLYFGLGARKTIKLKQTWTTSNSLLALHQEIIDEVKRYVFLPPGVDLLKRN